MTRGVISTSRGEARSREGPPRTGPCPRAASRAYYAMFHAGMALVMTKGHRPRTHRGLAHLLTKEFVGSWGLSEELVASYREQQQAREMGDYELDFPLGEEEVEELIAGAAVFLERVREVLG